LVIPGLIFEKADSENPFAQIVPEKGDITVRHAALCHDDVPGL